MTQQVHKTDEDFMRQALALGRFGLGMTAPNPAVCCVLVKDGQLIGCGVTQKSGRPHAEAMALAEAGDAAQGATAGPASRLHSRQPVGGLAAGSFQR